jgi:type I restriction enzyme S subunit
VPVAGKSKVQSRDYKPAGRFPIIDQGQEQIAGWTDDENAVIDAPLPLVVFGDHTRVFKFVDTPFARGADGTQLLRPKPEIDPLFFFYACRSVDLPARGYNRHFTVLKEKELSYPTDGDEQKAIAGVLRQTESALQKQFELLQTLQELKQAAMRELFTRGLRGEPQKETEIGPVPEGWEIVPLGSICIATDQVDLTTEGSRRIQYIDVSCVSREALAVVTTNEYLLRDAPGRARKRVFNGDVIFATIRPTLCRVARIPPEMDNQVCSTAFCVLRTNDPRGLGKFIFYAIQRPEFIDLLARIETGASYPAVTDRQVKAQPIPLPQKEERDEIVAILDAIDRKIELHRKKREVLEELFKALLHKLMTGEIRVDELDSSALVTATERGLPCR